MQPLTGKEIAARVSGMTSPKHQVHGYAVDLTVKSISAVDPVGRVDFGGSEYIPAGRVAVAALRRNPDDRYQWWDLGRGSYFLEFNESIELAADEVGVLEPDDRLLRAGGSHATVFIRGRANPAETLIDVDVTRLQIKQNARTSRVRIFRFGGGAGAAVTSPIAAPSAKSSGKPARKRK